MAYIAVDEQLISKSCDKNSVCFWARVAVVNPANTKDVYLFDCTFFEHVREEYRETPETRVLLSFKLPIDVSQLHYTGKMMFNEVSGSTSCDQSDVEECITRAIEYVEKRLNETRELLRERDKPLRDSISRMVFPRFTKDVATLKGIYYGLLVKESMLRDITSRLGFNGKSLNSTVKPAYMLVSLNFKKNTYTALVLGSKIKLTVHERVVDKNSLLTRLSQQQ